MKARWLWPVVIAASPVAADPLGFVDYDALLAARLGNSFCAGGRLCTVVLPDGGIVQQDATGRWHSGGEALTAGSYALGYALILAIFDHCDRYLEGVDPDAVAQAVAQTMRAYRAGLGLAGTAQAQPEPAQIEAAFDALRARLSGFIESDPDLSRCIVPGPLAIPLVEMAQPDTWESDLERLQQDPRLPTAQFSIE